MRTVLSLLIVSAAVLGDAAADCRPDPMLKVVYRDVTPGVAAGTFLEKPKTLYRLGNKYGRLEEAPDAEAGIHQLIVTSEPDMWVVNLLSKTGNHMIDPGPTFNFHAPIVWLEEGPSVIRELEFGCELSFFKAHKAKLKGKKTMDGKQYDRYEINVQKWRLDLLYDSQGGIPFEVSVHEGKKPLQVLRYDAYQPKLEPDMSLFAAPEGVVYSEGESQEAKAHWPGTTRG
jgi:hypothetical protein